MQGEDKGLNLQDKVKIKRIRKKKAIYVGVGVNTIYESFGSAYQKKIYKLLPYFE